MKKEFEVTKYLIYSYERQTGNRIQSELKLQKLMYFSQRESLCLTGHQLFDEEFEGWIHGPVLPSLRYCLENSEVFDIEGGFSLTEEEKYVIDNTIAQYAKYDAWYLRDLSHEEYCWQKSREGLTEKQQGFNKIKLDDIRVDANKLRPYDSVFDMYVDEFEDIED
ncbi:MAG: DUF4065 domain-containing protein [Finegoldia magna]|uniref:Panacea domain-containing protein n=2 Tax=Finegoldia magna TaxID=1260 RepID=UPI00248DA0B6|nr:type II toxin-antitoxin system antitoxin SocA domain-containing protein [Finegoldia magna]MDU5215520.1 DUF4065 domain-containing protein [Finegoldia magna]MDU5273641.1 DUF4065 domain-containing protein [Finegoldia magna]MDU5508622.1 DUF4065 domain-containing protein [Finegoldia magna]